jgi:XRE family transcriptional regulator, fatty acid utilization regulator
MTPKVYAGAKLRDVRQRVMLSQRDFAQRLGVSIPYLSQMENNHRFNTYDDLSHTNLPYK